MNFLISSNIILKYFTFNDVEHNTRTLDAVNHVLFKLYNFLNLCPFIVIKFG